VQIDVEHRPSTASSSQTVLASLPGARGSEVAADLAGRLRTAKAGGYEWVTSPFFLDLVLRKPKAM
jgi:hypothetical protein